MLMFINIFSKVLIDKDDSLLIYWLIRRIYEIFNTLFSMINNYLYDFKECNQNSNVDGSGFGTFKLFLNKNYANLSTGSFGNYFRISIIPYDKIGTKFTSKYFLNAKDFLSKIYLS